jgi:hypothetical protein
MPKAALAETAELTRQKAEGEAGTAALAKFLVESARFYYSENRITTEPVIDVTVRNSTDQTISRFYARGVLTSPGRETPWVDGTFNYSIRGGIKPGESQNFKLAPNMFGEWAKAPKDRTDMVLAVTINRVDGSDEKQLFKSDFNDEKAKRLAALEKLIAEHGWK